MTEVFAIFGILVALEIVFPCILTFWWSLFPASVERAHWRINSTPWRCFWLGCLTAIISLPPIFVLFVLPLELSRVMGCMLLFVLIAFAGLGAAGVSVKIGGRFAMRYTKAFPADITIRRSIVKELAVGLWLGGATTVIVLPAIVVLLDLDFKLIWTIGWSVFFLALAIAGLFATVSAARRNVQLDSSKNASALSVFIRGVVVLELAAGLPIIGWFILFPFAFVTSLGASVFALLRWMPPVAARPAHSVSLIKRIAVPFVVFLWVLPFSAVSLSVVAFIVRGAIVMEAASGFSVIGWLVIVPLYIIVLLG
ncbi:MAG: hypothetical protein JSV02_00080, partial [Dehalococcoidia bacterium]